MMDEQQRYPRGEPSQKMSDGSIECVIVPMPLYDTVMGMLMHLWALVKDPETKQVVHETMERLRLVVEDDGE